MPMTATLRNQTTSFVALVNGWRLDLEWTPSAAPWDWCASDADTGYFGEGATPDEAISDFLIHMDILRADLEEHEAVLHPDLAAQLRVLRTRTAPPSKES